MKALALLAVASIAVAGPVQAQTVEGTILGYQVEVNDSGSYDAPDFIAVWGPHGPERVTVTCAPFDWQSHGANSVEFVDSIARAWCF